MSAPGTSLVAAGDRRDSGRTALIVGASRGLGLGLAREYLGRGWDVIATSRGADLPLSAHDGEGQLHHLTLDVTDISAVAALPAAIDAVADDELALLFVVAGISGDKDVPAGRANPDQFAQVMHTNALAPLQILEAMADRVRPDGAIVVMTSVLGSVSGNTSGGYDMYRASKAALNTMLRSFAARHPNRTVIAMHPGWVRTDMGGSAAPLSIEDSARRMADAIAGRAGAQGCVFIDYKGATIPW